MMHLFCVLSDSRVFKSFTAGMLAAGLLLGAGLSQVGFAQEPNLMMVSVASEPAKAHAKNVQAKVLIDAPPSLVWQTITNYSDLKNILPGYEKSNVLKSSGARKQLEIAMKVAPFLPTYNYHVQVQESADNYQIVMNRVSGDFKELRATYKLISQGNGSKTLLSYSLNIDPGYNMPGSQAVIKSSTERSLKALEKHVEAAARKSLIGQR
ncbi:MAG TPA: SRPBCC family protein [Coleofasciculaceae cyanobacterium]|jgi:ribosome-associated toxin RatA of RatAB toxin-antitoxin module